MTILDLWTPGPARSWNCRLVPPASCDIFLFLRRIRQLLLLGAQAIVAGVGSHDEWLLVDF
jgi:hypothetical protein